MNEKDYRNIVYSIWYKITDKKLLINDLINELINNWEIKNENEFSEYSQAKFDIYFSIINDFTMDEFNDFVKQLINYINKNFNKEDYYYLTCQVLNHFLWMYNLDRKFKNQWFIKIINDLYNEIINESKNEYTKSFEVKWLLGLIN